MRRRDFLKTLATLGITAAAFPGMLGMPRTALGQVPGLYQGPILVTLHARGGWDHSFFADPRENPTINRWASATSAGIAGNLRYAPVGENQAFFDKYFDSMLVINGIDVESGSHSSGARYRTTGRLGNGYPQLNELFAAVYGQGLPMAFVGSDDYGIPGTGLQARSDLPSEATMRTIANPNDAGNGATHLRLEDYAILRRFQDQRLQAELARANQLPRRATRLNALAEARAGADGLEALANNLPTAGFDQNDLAGTRNRLVPKLHLFLATAGAGMTTSGVFGMGG